MLFGTIFYYTLLKPTILIHKQIDSKDNTLNLMK